MMYKILAHTLALMLFTSATLLSGSPIHASDLPDAFLYQEDFEDRQAQGWELEPGWSVREDSGNSVLAGEEHHWAINNQWLEGNYQIAFRLKVDRERIHIIIKMNDVGRYFIGFDDGGSVLNKQYWQDTFLNDLAIKRVNHAVGVWHEVTIQVEGDEIIFSVNGQEEWHYRDPEPLQAGTLAFETLDGAAAQIDDIVITSAGGEGAPPAATALAPPMESALVWTRLGGPLGGLGYDVRMRPGNPDNLYVTDAWSGVFISEDGGEGWFPSNEGILARTGTTADSIPIFCLTIDPNDPDIVWAGTQNIRGIYRSGDAGRTWSKHDSGVIEQDGITFRGFTVEPGNSDVVYAAAELSSWVLNNGREKMGREFDMTGGVVYRSDNGGVSWRAVWRGDNLARYVWIDPRDVNVLYISTGIFDREAFNSDPVAGTPGGEGVLKSTDGGATWQPVNNGLNNLYIGSLFMHPENPDILLAGAGNNQYNQGNGAYLTRDGGASWQHVVREGNIEAVEFAELDPNIAYAAGADAVFRSTDGGESWEVVAGSLEDTGWGAPGTRAGFPIDLQVDPRDPNRLFANAYGGGNFLSEDGGRTWVESSQGYTGAQVRAIAVDPTQPGRVLAAARSGLFTSDDGGVTWEGLSHEPVAVLEWNAVAIDPSNPQHILSETNWNQLLVSSQDSGQTWNIAHSLSGGRVGWQAIEFAPSDPLVVYAGSAGFYSAGSFDPSRPAKGIFRSTDGGARWNEANDDLSDDAHVTSLAIDPQDSQVVFAATTNHGLLKTVDGGLTWKAVTGGLPQDSALAVAVNPLNGEFVIAGFDRKLLFISQDSGETWTRSNPGLMPEAKITSIVFDPIQPDTLIYMADVFSGVYRSVNGGVTWERINDGLTNRAVTALALSADGMHLYAATDGAGAFRLDLNGALPPAAKQMPTPPPAATAKATKVAATSAPQVTLTPVGSEPPIENGDGKGAFPCAGALILPFGVVGVRLLQRKRAT